MCAVFFGSCPAAFAAGGDAYVESGQNVVVPLSTNWFSGSGRVTFDEFEGKNPYGTWYIYIKNTGSGFTDVSTASARMTVNYSY